MNRLLLVVLAGILSQLPSLGWAQTQNYTISLTSVADRALVGQRVDVFVRRIANDDREDLFKLVLSNVPLVAAPADQREATLMLDDKEIRKLQKFEKIGHDLVLRPRKEL